MPVIGLIAQWLQHGLPPNVVSLALYLDGFQKLFFGLDVGHYPGVAFIEIHPELWRVGGHTVKYFEISELPLILLLKSIFVRLLEEVDLDIDGHVIGPRQTQNPLSFLLLLPGDVREADLQR